MPEYYFAKLLFYLDFLVILQYFVGIQVSLFHKLSFCLFYRHLLLWQGKISSSRLFFWKSSTDTSFFPLTKRCTGRKVLASWTSPPGARVSPRIQKSLGVCSPLSLILITPFTENILCEMHVPFLLRTAIYNECRAHRSAWNLHWRSSTIRVRLSFVVRAVPGMWPKSTKLRMKWNDCWQMTAAGLVKVDLARIANNLRRDKNHLQKGRACDQGSQKSISFSAWCRPVFAKKKCHPSPHFSKIFCRILIQCRDTTPGDEYSLFFILHLWKFYYICEIKCYTYICHMNNILFIV